MAQPEHMTIEPYDHQLKGAAQIHHACLGPFAGMILGDSEFLDKTIQAVLAIYLAKDLPGKSLVVVPEGLVDHWLQKFSDVWEQVTCSIFKVYTRKKLTCLIGIRT